MNKPKILALDIETSHIKANIWAPGEQYVRHQQIERDWTVLSWSAKFVGEPTMYTGDVFKQRNKFDDSKMLRGLVKLIEQADVILSQNGKRFDVPKILARLIINDFEPIDHEKEHIDTRRLAKKFGFSSSSLEYMCKILKTKHQKLKHGKFPGEDLWHGVIAGNPSANAEMRKYNDWDVYCLEDVYMKLRPWGINVNLAKYTATVEYACPVCTSIDVKKNGYAHKGNGRYQRYLCNSCGALTRGKVNLLSPEKKAALKGRGR
jgi:DNA polymerase elongation subunit (family B)